MCMLSTVHIKEVFTYYDMLLGMNFVSAIWNGSRYVQTYTMPFLTVRNRCKVDLYVHVPRPKPQNLYAASITLNTNP